MLAFGVRFGVVAVAVGVVAFVVALFEHSVEFVREAATAFFYTVWGQRVFAGFVEIDEAVFAELGQVGGENLVGGVKESL